MRDILNAAASRRVLVLDGAMGSMIQKLKLGETDFRGGPNGRFANHPSPLAGCNDLLCLTQPQAIGAIHEAYLEAGADIIETCSFNSTAVSLADYGLGSLAWEISAAAARIARTAADKFSTAEKPRFVAGSIGPTGKSASLSPDVQDPAKRGIYWDELEAAFYDNARGLVDGGADILIVETIFDTLNVKAALSAIARLQAERNADIPVMISATVSGDSGRLLAGQTLEAFCTSVLHSAPWSIGLNCSFGAALLLPHVRTLAATVPCMVSAHPNAGLPNQLGEYDESPQSMAACIEGYLRDGLVNVIGGCCGSTPAHIAAIAEKAALYQPRKLPQGNVPYFITQRRKDAEESEGIANGALSFTPCALKLAGLEPLTVERHKVNDIHASGIYAELRLTLIGERTNVSGSKKFLRLISEENYREALALARGMIEDGAAILTVGMDDAMLDAEKSMCAFLDHALADPDIAKVPVMIDSSRWNVIEAGLKRLQGKGIVNSINLKDGEAEFLRRAALVRHYGAAVVVMLIDERGQAVSYERKIEIAGRAYGLLVASGFPPQDIVFDPNVLAVATGIAEHDACGLDFIRACTWIRDNCPGVQISGGVTNLSYSFRGNNPLRQAMHSVFLAHAQNAGLTMAIIDPSKLTPYTAIEENLRTAIEDVILNRNPQGADNLLEIAKSINPSPQSPVPSPQSPDWRLQAVESRIVYAMIHGIDDYIEADVLELMESASMLPLAIVEGPLMDGMKEVGKRFDEGTMYLPQVIRSARVMKKAAAALEPFMEKNTDANGVLARGEAPKVVLATVKGDVHDIGKNIVGVVLACNGYQIIDLGVMVPAEKIIETAEREGAAMIGLSALIAPSLDEMARVAQAMEQRHMNIPLLIGGAAASPVHTGLRLVPQYSWPVVYVPNAGKSAETVRALLSETERPRFLHDLEQKYREAAARHEAIQSRLELLPLPAARANKQPPAPAAPAPKRTGIIDLNNYPLDRVTPYIDWQGFAREWEAEKVPGTLLDDAKAMLETIKAERLVELRGVAGMFPAASDGDDIVISANGSIHRLCFLRSQQKKPAGTFNPCLADFIAPPTPDPRPPIPNSPFPIPHSPFPNFPDSLGLFALSAGFGLDAAEDAYRRRHDEYGALLLATLANALAEAFAEEVHLRVRREWWAYAPDESSVVGIRPAFGYPSCPDHEDKRIAFNLLEAENRCGLKLTESAMIIPAASVCGMFFANPTAYIFGVGPVGDDQIKDWAERKGISIEDARRRM